MKLLYLDGKVMIFGWVIDGYGMLDVLEWLVVDEWDWLVRDVKIERVMIYVNLLV